MKITPKISVSSDSLYSVSESLTEERQKITFVLPEGDPLAETFEVNIQFPYVDCAGVWHPTCSTYRANNADWSGPVRSMTARSAPVLSVFSDDSLNRCTIALSEVREEVRIFAGIHEEDGMFRIRIQLPLTGKRFTQLYTISLLIDTRPVSFSRALADVAGWWEEECGLTPAIVPEAARKPVYSTWYNFHQQFTAEALEKECALAAKAGMETVIVDDGWQTDDVNRGYAYCGDWEVCPSKIPDMRGHVERIHALGMKYMLWLSVPFMGIHSNNWERFKDKMLYYSESMSAGVLDPRYPDVRQFLVDTYLNVVESFGLDGLKLDFIDSFVATKDTPPHREGMDFADVQSALDCLMTQVSQALTARRPEFLIEFRQNYIGPNMRKYGNMFRVSDCPNSALSNRIGTVDLRLLSGSTAVHSDMLMWHPKERPEEISLQVISSIFSTVQISTLLEKLGDRQRKCLDFWLSFMAQNRALLQEAPLEAKEPHNLYPLVEAAGKGHKIAAVYTQDRVVECPENCGKLTVLNGAKGNWFYLSLPQDRKCHIKVLDCCGELVMEEDKNLSAGVCRFPAAVGGVLELS